MFKRIGESIEKVKHGRIQRGVGGQGIQMSSGKSQVAIGFLRNTGMDPLKKGLNFSSKEVRMKSVKYTVRWWLKQTRKKTLLGPIFSRREFVQSFLIGVK